MFSSDQAAQLCEDLSLARGIPRLLRDQARHELYQHLNPAPHLFPSWRAKKLTFVPPPGWRPMNPCVTRLRHRILCAMRATNYVIDDRGPSPIEGTANFSRTFLLDVDPDSLGDRLIHEMFLPDGERRLNESAPAGFEDTRIIGHEGDLWAVMCRCDQNEEGWPEQWGGKIKGDTFEPLWRLRSPEMRRPEKNWIPLMNRNELAFIYSCDPVVLLTHDGKKLAETRPRIDATHFRGSSQGIPFEDGLLVLVHHVTLHKGWPKNQHRFVWFDKSLDLERISDAFLFPAHFEFDYLNGYQYGMGICWHTTGSDLLLSYSVGDGQSWLATLSAADVASKLRSV